METMQSFDTLCLPHRAELVAVARRYTGQEHTAEDLVQDAYVRAFRHWELFKQETDDINRDVKVWLKKILTNTFYTQYQRDQRRSQAHDEFGQELEECDETPANEEVERLQKVMKKLRPMYKEVLEKHYIEGHTYQQIADDLGIKFVQVQKRLYRARQYIKMYYEHMGVAPSRTSVDPTPSEPVQSKQAKPDRVNRVVTRDDTKPLRRRKSVPNTLPTR